MKKFIFALVLLIISYSLILGCNRSNTTKGVANKPVSENTISQSVICENSKEITKNELIEIAYNFLTEDEKSNILPIENTKVYELKIAEDYLVINSNVTINIKNTEVYKISFEEINPTKIGPPTVFIDKKTLEILGVGLGE